MYVVYKYNNKDKCCIWFTNQTTQTNIANVYKSNNKDRYCILFTNLTIKTNVAYDLQIKQQRQILQMVYKSNNKDR